jgi:hypothetical protein
MTTARASTGSACCRLAGFGAGLALLLTGTHALAFPPYRSTDAETADPFHLEGRLGLVRYERDAGDSTFTSPLLRVNFGLPKRIELTTEFEYLPVEGEVGDAAAGLKWVPYFERLSLGIEALALLPVSSAGGAGVESQLLATQRWDSFQLHLNLGGFYDARPAPIEKGWRGGLLGEAKLGRFRPGAELFAKQVTWEAVVAQAGLGLIVSLGPIDLRSGVHVGLTQAAPDFVTSLWIAGKLALSGDEETQSSKASGNFARCY